MAGPLPEGELVPDAGIFPLSAAEGASSRTLSAYLHIPFCSHRCGYCDFNTYTASELRGVTRDGYLSALEAEIAWSPSVLQKSGFARRPLHSVFIGGGTPTLLPARALTHTLDVLREHYEIAEHAEITVEANPDTLSGEYLETLALGGVTRLSMGMQSASPHVLATLERTHDPDNVGTAVAWAKDAGLDVSIDLIYGTPGESLEDWRMSLETALEYGLNHLSAYSLIVEDGTALARKIRQGKLADPDPDLQADMYELADALCEADGLQWYEISNWSRSAETASAHNRAYWTGQDWWGFGPGAHSHMGGVRSWNAKHPAAYRDRISAGITPAIGREILTEQQRNLERYLLESRLRDGLRTDDIEPLILADLTDDGLITVERGRAVLTVRGRLRADEVTRRLVTD